MKSLIKKEEIEKLENYLKIKILYNPESGFCN
jgi:hypothetical protein